MEALRCRRCGETLVAKSGQKVQCQSCLTVYSVKTATAASALLAAQSPHSALPKGFVCVYSTDDWIPFTKFVICDRCSLQGHRCWNWDCEGTAPPGQITCDACAPRASDSV